MKQSMRVEAASDGRRVSERSTSVCFGLLVVRPEVNRSFYVL